jgi:hypothetical protein
MNTFIRLASVIIRLKGATYGLANANGPHMYEKLVNIPAVYCVH